jgi:hypothetical protein
MLTIWSASTRAGAYDHADQASVTPAASRTGASSPLFRPPAIAHALRSPDRVGAAGGAAPLLAFDRGLTHLRTDEASLTPIDQVVLVFGLRRPRKVWTDAMDLAMLAGARPRCYRAISASLQRLSASRLIVLREESVTVRYRRTREGTAVAERLLRDDDISFMEAIYGG